MSLSDCEKCWDTPCTCGNEYKNYSKDALIKLMSSMLNYFSKDDSIDILAKIIILQKNKS